MARRTIHLDFNPVWKIIDEVTGILDDLDDGSATISVEVEMKDGRDKNNDPDKARIARDLLRTAELANLLGQELHMRYWEMKGNPDPRKATP